MAIKRMVLIVTCVVVAALGWFFAAPQWETAGRTATVASALAGVAAIGAAIWAALPGSGQAGIAVMAGRRGRRVDVRLVATVTAARKSQICGHLVAVTGLSGFNRS